MNKQQYGADVHSLPRVFLIRSRDLNIPTFLNELVLLHRFTTSTTTNEKKGNS